MATKEARENEAERLAAQLTQEVRDQAPRLATALFPKGPPGHQELGSDQELDLIARQWHDPSFRKTLLMRVAPPGPNGYPDPVLAERFIELYRKAVLERGSVEQDTPTTPAEAAASVGPTGADTGVTLAQGQGPAGAQTVALPGTPAAPGAPPLPLSPGQLPPAGLPGQPSPPPTPGPTQVTQPLPPAQPGVGAGSAGGGLGLPGDRDDRDYGDGILEFSLPAGTAPPARAPSTGVGLGTPAAGRQSAPGVQEWTLTDIPPPPMVPPLPTPQRGT